MSALANAFQRNVNDGWREITDQELSKMRTLLLSMEEESQDTMLLKRERKAFDAVERLANMRRTVDQRLEDCKQNKIAFEKKQAELRKMAQDNEQFIRYTDTKIESCEKKAREEQAACKLLEVEIKKIEENLIGLYEQKDEYVKQIDKISHYKYFFEKVVTEYEEEFEGDLENLINREGALRKGAVELEGKNTKLQEKLDKLRDAWITDQTRLQNEQLVLNSTLHECKVKLERSRVENREIENKLKGALEEKEWKESNFGVMKLAIDQLLIRILNSCRLPQRKKAISDFLGPPRGQEERYKMDLVLKVISERMHELIFLKTKIQDIKSQTAGQDLNFTGKDTLAMVNLDDIAFIPGLNHS